MNKDEAFTRGANAFYKKEPRSAMLEPAFHPFTSKGVDLSSSKTQELFKQWYKGWDQANLDSDYSDVAEHAAAAKAEALNEKILTHGPWKPDPQAEREEARERWLEDLEYKKRIKKELGEFKATKPEGVTFNNDGSITFSADWIKNNAKKN